MSNYFPSTDFATKDSLPSGDPLKIVRGTEINTEFVDISDAILTKADIASPTFTGLVTGTVAYQPAGTGAVATTVQAKLRESVSVKDFGAIGDGVTDDTAAIQAAVDYVETLYGGTVSIPSGTYKISSTINMNGGYGVQLIGQGGDGIHDSGMGAEASTILRWAGATGGTVIHVASPVGAGNSRQYGAAVVDLKIDCQSAAGIGLLVTSIKNGNFSRLFIYSPTIAAVKTTTFGNALLAESSDVQRCVFDRVSFRCIDTAATRAAHGFWLTSHAPASSNSNTSLNVFTQCEGQSWGGSGSGYGLFMEDGDNNYFNNLRIIRAAGTVVEGVRLVGNPSCDANHFWNLSVGGANSISIRGTASGFSVNPKRSSFWVADAGNGTQYPAVDSGVVFGWHSDENVFRKHLVNQGVFADGDATAIAQLANIGNASLLVFNTSSNHSIFSDGTNTWAVGIDSATGDFRILRLSGSGAVNVGGGGPVKIFGQLVGTGAANSGGTGFRVLTVPN